MSVEMSQPFITFEAELPWIYPLVYELGSFGPSMAISLGASSLFLRRRSMSWPYVYSGDRTKKELWTYPPGFNRRLGFFFDRPIRAKLNKHIRRLYEQTGKKPYVILPNPRLFQYVRDVDPAQLIYLNYDDYSVDFSTGVRLDNPAEDALIHKARMVLCASDFQMNRFKERFPSQKSKVFHFPHGVHSNFINPLPGKSPKGHSVCVVGWLGSRYDWRLIKEVVTKLKGVTFYFVGEIRRDTFVGELEFLFKYLEDVLSCKNAIHVPGVKHENTKEYYWKSSINWMPYKIDMPFVKASCPLKISDGLASGRQVVSADVPECRLYPEWISIYHDSIEAVSVIRNALNRSASSKEGERSLRQISFAAANTWGQRASWLHSTLETNLTHSMETLVCNSTGNVNGQFRSS
ncbi:MAG: hypothetical protein KKH22_10500 [Proteobacteria bacterium]|nr:hypothetical protein [Pseudomonadota bacterium]